MAKQKFDSLIQDLADDLLPAEPMHHPAARFTLWAVLSLVYMTAAVWGFGLRPDMANKFADPVFLLETSLMVAIALFAGLCSFFLCIPDMRGAPWLKALPLTLLGVFVGWEIIRALTEGVAMPEIRWIHCFSDAMIFAVIPSALITFTTCRKGASTCSFSSAGMSILAVGALGYVGLRLSCMNDTIGHVGVYHIFPYLLAGGLFGFIAQRLFRW